MKKKILLPLLIATSIAIPTSLLTVVSCAQKETKTIGITGHYSDKVHFQNLQYETGKDFSTTFTVDDGYDIENCIWYINDKIQTEGVTFSYQLRTISCKASMLNNSNNVTIKVLVQKEHPIPQGYYRFKYLGAEGLTCTTKIVLPGDDLMIDFSAVGNQNIYSVNKLTIGGNVIDPDSYIFDYSYHYDRDLFSLYFPDASIVNGDIFVEFSMKEGIFFNAEGTGLDFLRGQLNGRAEKGKQLELSYRIPQSSNGKTIDFHKICSNGKELVKGIDYDYEMDDDKTSIHITVKASATINDLIIYLDSTI